MQDRLAFAVLRGHVREGYDVDLRLLEASFDELLLEVVLEEVRLAAAASADEDSSTVLGDLRSHARLVVIIEATSQAGRLRQDAPLALVGKTLLGAPMAECAFSE